MNRLASLIRGLPEEELILLKKDLDEGNIGRLIAERVAELDLPQKICPTCQSPLDDNAPFVLLFGTGIRKKARFDGRDCLQQFLDDME